MRRTAIPSSGWRGRNPVVRTQCARKLPVYLVGFSMGGVIASWLASRYPIEKLALIAPAFTYLDLGKAAGYLKKGTRMIFASSDPGNDDVQVPPTFYPAFIEIIKTCRDSIASASVRCSSCMAMRTRSSR